MGGRKTRKKAAAATSSAKYATATSYSLDHSFDNGQSFQPRGKFSLRSYNTRNGTKWKVSFEEQKLFANEPAKFENLMRTGGYYRVKVRPTESPKNVDYVVSFIPACSLFESKFKEYFMLRTDDFGHIMAMEYANNVQRQDCSVTSLPTEIKFRPKAVVVPATDVPNLPATIAGNLFYKDGQKGINGEKGKQPQQQQSFFQKYVRDSEASILVMDVKKLRHTSNRLLYTNKQILL